MIVEEIGERFEDRLSGLARWRFWNVPLSRARLVTLAGFAVFALGSVLYAALGQTNADEGWYLYTSRLVFQGALPYRDFAYTQMPLMPYIFGVVQIIYPSLLWGRLTSVLFAIGTALMGIVIARRFAGSNGSALAALLFAAFTLGLYFDAIVKTYALISFCFTASLFVLTSNMRAALKLPLALAFAFGAAMVRVNTLFFVAPVLVYALAVAPNLRSRALLVAESAAFGVAAALFLLPDWGAARWNLFDSHLDHWGDLSLFSRFVTIAQVRLPDIFTNFAPVFVLVGASAYFLWRFDIARPWSKRAQPLAIAALGLFLFGGSNLLNGLWSTEYVVPAVTSFLPLLAVMLARVYQQQDSSSRVFVQGTLAAALLLLPLSESVQYIDLTGRQLPLVEMDQVAAFVAHNTQPTDKVLALEALAVAVDARRAALPGITLAQFSLQEMDTATAQELHVVNTGMLVDYVNQMAPAAVVLTDDDWSMLYDENGQDAAAIRTALDQQYYVGFSLPRFGQFAHTVYVYLRN